MIDFTIWYAASVAEKIATGECNLWLLKYLWLSEEHFYWKKIVYFVTCPHLVLIQPIRCSVISTAFSKMKWQKRRPIILNQFPHDAFSLSISLIETPFRRNQSSTFPEQKGNGSDNSMR